MVDEDIQERIDQAAAKAFAYAVDHALAQDDFDEEECKKYMALAYEKDDCEAYGKCLDFLGRMAPMSLIDALGAARSSYFGLRAAVLAAVVERNLHLSLPPSADSVGSVDFLSAGIVMAIGVGNAHAAASLAKSGLLAGQSEVRIAGIFEKSMETARRARSAFMINDEEFAKLSSVCEMAQLKSLTPDARKCAQGRFSL